MKSQRAGTLIFIVGMALALGALFFVPASPARGWGLLVGFGLTAVPWLFGMWPGQTRRRDLAQAAYTLLIAVELSSGYLWPAEPSWLQNAMSGLLVVVVVWFIVEQRRQAAADRAASGSHGAAQMRSRVILGRIIGLALLVAVPAVIWFVRIR